MLHRNLTGLSDNYFPLQQLMLHKFTVAFCGEWTCVCACAYVRGQTNWYTTEVDTSILCSMLHFHNYYLLTIPTVHSDHSVVVVARIQFISSKLIHNSGIFIDMHPCTSTGSKDYDLGTPLTLYHTDKERYDIYLWCVLRSFCLESET